MQRGGERCLVSCRRDESLAVEEGRQWWEEWLDHRVCSSWRTARRAYTGLRRHCRSFGRPTCAATPRQTHACSITPPSRRMEAAWLCKEAS